MKKLISVAVGSDVLPQIFIEKYKILFITIKSQFEIAKAFPVECHQSCKVPPYICLKTLGFSSF